MTFTEFFKQGYSLIESAQTEQKTSIELDEVEFDGTEDITSIINMDGAKMNVIDTVYYDINPTFDVLFEHKVIEEDLSFDELEKFIGDK